MTLATNFTFSYTYRLYNNKIVCVHFFGFPTSFFLQFDEWRMELLPSHPELVRFDLFASSVLSTGDDFAGVVTLLFFNFFNPLFKNHSEV